MAGCPIWVSLSHCFEAFLHVLNYLPSSLDLLFRGIDPCLCLHGDGTSSSLAMAGPWPCHPHWGLTSSGPFCCFIGTVPLKNAHHVLNNEAKNLFSVFIFLDVSMLFAFLISDYFKSLPPITSETPALLLLLSSTCQQVASLPFLPHEGGQASQSAHSLPFFITARPLSNSLVPTDAEGPSKRSPCWLSEKCLIVFHLHPKAPVFLSTREVLSLPLLHLPKSDPSFKVHVTHCPLTSVSE